VVVVLLEPGRDSSEFERRIIGERDDAEARHLRRFAGEAEQALTDDVALGPAGAGPREQDVRSTVRDDPVFSCHPDPLSDVEANAYCPHQRPR
jgi:hypothetical protein